MPDASDPEFAVAVSVAGVVPLVLSKDNQLLHSVPNVTEKLTPEGLLVTLILCAGTVLPPATLNGSTEGLAERLVVAWVAKFAVTVCGAVIATVVAALVALATLPIQPVNEYPLEGAALIDTAVPES